MEQVQKERLKIINIEHNSKLLTENVYDDIFKLINKAALSKAHPKFPYVNIIDGNISLTSFSQEFVKNIF